MNFYSIYYILLLIVINLRLIEFSITQTLEDLLNPKCDGNNLSYSIIANLEEYLKYQNNIDGREMFDSLKIFKTKTLGTISGTYYNKTNFQSVKEYDTYDQLFGDLKTLKIDGVIQPDRYAEDVVFFQMIWHYFLNLFKLIKLDLEFKKIMDYLKIKLINLLKIIKIFMKKE